MSVSPAVAVIILNWNGEALLREYLPKVIDTTNPSVAKVIVADNGSTDGSLALLEKDFPQVELMVFDRNYGFAEGYNKAVALASDYKYVVLLNSDVATSDGWIDTLYDYMEKHPEVAAAQPKLLSYRQPSMFEYAGASGGFLDRNGYPYCRGRIFDTCEKDEGQYEQPRQIFWASGAAMMVVREDYIAAGGLDPDFFAHMEEIDLSWRILLSGKKIVAVPQAVVYHLGGGSLPVDNPKKTYLNFRNNLLMLHKNLPDGIRGRKLFWRRMLDSVAWLKFVLTADFKNARAIIKAHRDFARMRLNYKSHPDVNILKEFDESRINILVNYYLRGKKHFSDLF